MPPCDLELLPEYLNIQLLTVKIHSRYDPKFYWNEHFVTNMKINLLAFERLPLYFVHCK